MGLFSWSAAAFACIDNSASELVAWDAQLDSPTWRKPLPRHVVGLAGGTTILATLDENGQLSFWNGNDGTASGGAAIPGGRLVAMAPGRGCAVASEGRLHLLDARGTRSLPVAGVTALAFSRDDRQLAVALPEGRVMLLDVATGKVTGAARLEEGGTVTALTSRALGAEWLATLNDGLYAVDDSGARRVTGFDGTTLSAVAANEDGSLVALQAGHDLAVVFGWSTLETVANLQYPERKILGVALGRDALWVGLEGGDGNRLDLASGELHRTEPHPSRRPSEWVVSTGHRSIRPGPER